MVVQRDVPLPVWGTAEPGEEVAVALGEDKASAKADDKGQWKVTLPARKASAEGATLTVSGKNKIELTDILVGDVWVGSGQSNMEWPLKQSFEPQNDIQNSANPQIHLFTVPKLKPEPT